MLQRLGAKYVNSSLVRDPLRDPRNPQEFFGRVERLLPEAVRQVFKQAESLEVQVKIVNTEVIPYLRQVAPEGCIFGRNPFYTQCSDWGFWQIRMPLPHFEVEPFTIVWAGSLRRRFRSAFSAVVRLPNGEYERVCYHSHLRTEAARRCAMRCA
ncbi:MAG: hypothetical protein ACPLRM_00155, partial [Anaerolineae bacterium]